MQERRQARRTRAFTAATIVDGDGRTTDCVVRDLSAAGALLLVDHPGRVPGHLALDVDGQGDRHARVVRRGETGVGVVFMPAGRDNVIPFPASPRSGNPDTDRERLARRIARFVRPRDPGPR